LVIVDYLGLLKTAADNQRIELGRSVAELVGMAAERDFALVGVHQTNREALNVKLVTGAHCAEDYSIVQNASTVVIINRLIAEKERGLARLWVDKARSGVDAFGVVVSQDLGHGQFVVQSGRLNQTSYLDMINDLPILDHIG